MQRRLFEGIIFLLFSQVATAQSAVNTAYAITAERMGDQQWTAVRQVDLHTGAVVATPFDNNPSKYELVDGTSGKTMPASIIDSTSNPKRPFSGSSAACAYDRNTRRLYFAPLFFNELRYIDLGSTIPRVYLFSGQALINGANMIEEGNQVTRMAIAADGNGYAMTNDGHHLVRFTTGDIPVVTDLGAVSDAAGSDTVAISDRNTSWGGDMIADANGNLYVITAHNLVFQVSVQNRTARFVARIAGLPEGYNTNGAVVDADGNVVLSSAGNITGYYRVDPARWEAAIIPSEANVFNSSDLANENLLFQTQLSSVTTVQPEAIVVYPNPVTTGVFHVTFDHKPAGAYHVQLVDVGGGILADKQVNLWSSSQVVDYRTPKNLAHGLYWVKVLAENDKEIFSTKIVFQ